MSNVELTQEEKDFIDTESCFINGRLHHTKGVAQGLAQDHRYLVGEKAKLYIRFFEVLAENEEKGFYDARNEYACKCARVMIDALRKEKLL